MPKYIVSQPAITLCMESRSSRLPTTTSAPMSRNACARSSSFRTIARTALPCLKSSSVTLPPTPPTRPAAPVTRIEGAMFFPSVRSRSRALDPVGGSVGAARLSRHIVHDLLRAGMRLAGVVALEALLALRKVKDIRDQRKLLLEIDGWAKVYPDGRIELERSIGGVNFDL